MPTKADLENEITELRRELEEARSRAAAALEDAPEEDEKAETTDKGKESKLDWALGQLEGSEIDRLFREFVAELEDMQEHKPLLTLFGAFVLGYVLGRAR